MISTLLVLRSLDHDLVYWFGGWRPRAGLALGIAFDVEPLGAVLAALAGALMTASFVFAWRYFDEVGTLFHVLRARRVCGRAPRAASGVDQLRRHEHRRRAPPPLRDRPALRAHRGAQPRADRAGA